MGKGVKKLQFFKMFQINMALELIAMLFSIPLY